MTMIDHLVPFVEILKNESRTPSQGHAPSNPTRTYGGKYWIETVPTSEQVALPIRVITVVYNNSAQLRLTIESVLQRKRGNLKYIIVDGGSTDGTRDVLLSFNSELDYWFSEPDAGIYDAMNKAIDFAYDGFIYYLKSGDRLRCVPPLFNAPALNYVDCIAGVVRISTNGLHTPSAGVGLNFHAACSSRSAGEFI
jgi:hypothetical protein